MFGWIASRGAALSASILLHLLILLFGYYLQKDNLLSRFIPAVKELPQKKDFEWAATESAESQFGAPVEFQSLPEIIEPKEQALENIQENSIEEIIHEIEPKSTSHDTLKKEQEKPATKHAQTTSKKIDTYTTVEKTKQQTQKATSMQVSTPAKPTRDKSPRKPLTLSQLANGFLDHVKANGTNTITTLGKKGAMPTDEQLKHQRYAEKLSWCLQQSFKQNHTRLTDYHHCVVEVYLALNKNGTINQVSIAKPSGNPRVDQFVLFTFQDAQNSFPPVPSYFNEDPYKIMYIIQVDSMIR